MFDTIIKNARVIDGTGAKWYRADIGIKGDTIAAIGRLEGEAQEVYDAHDMFVCPGFIDIHSHSDQTILGCIANDSRILQGVTTEIAGNCGMSMAPATDEHIKDLIGYTAGDGDYKWRSMKDFLDTVEAAKPATNFAALIGHGTVRLAVMGYSDKKPTAHEMDKIKALSREAMEDGAFGMTSGLIYPPGSFADTDELAEIVSSIAPYGGFYATHMRDEEDNIIEAVNEALTVAKRAGVPLEISHHKVCKASGWRVLANATVAMIERARSEGQDVTCDQYPYRATATTLSVNMPEWAFEGGWPKLRERLHNEDDLRKIRAHMYKSHHDDWDTISVSYVNSTEDEWLCGMAIPDIAKKLGCDCEDALIRVVLMEENNVGEIHFGMCEDDIELIMSKPFTMAGSDGEARSLTGRGLPHPRNFGTFPRVLAHYCRERRLFPVEEAVRKLSSMQAARAGLYDRGLVRPNMKADLVIFDFDKIRDDPDFIKPAQACSGIARVYVNGVLAAENGIQTGRRAGMVLRKNK